MSNICEKHQAAPAKIYSQCIGCEIDNLNKRIKEQEELLRWFRGQQGWTGWTRVEGRLPGHNETVLLHFTDGEIESGYMKIYDGKLTEVIRGGIVCKHKDVTYWMPLPEPPETTREEVTGDERNEDPKRRIPSR